MNVWLGTSLSAIITLIIAVALWRISSEIIDRTPRKPAPPKQLTGPDESPLLEAKADDPA